MEGVFGLLAIENLLNGEDLQARVGGAVCSASALQDSCLDCSQSIGLFGE
jgi:hypothetical protein